MNNFSVKITLKVEIKILSFLILLSVFFSPLALSETHPSGDSIPTVSNLVEDLLPKLKAWWSGDKTPSELSIEDQVFKQLGSLTLLDLAPLSREEIISKLKDDFDISIKTDNSELFNRYFLAYLYSYFEMMFPQPFVFSPLYLHALPNSSPKLVRKEGDNLYFSKNAGDRIINNTFGKFLFDEFSQSTELPDEMTVTFEYSNKLYDQLNEVMLTAQNIKDFIGTHMGVTFKLEKTDPLYKDTQSFIREELLILLKQILDMPFHLRDSMTLKKIVRMGPGYQPPNASEPVKATYNPHTQTIQFMDPTFDELDGDSRGETTILHEMAHAVWSPLSTSLWYGLPLSVQQEYAKLSWDGGTKISDEFITEYSASEVTEDFAEHVAFYIDNSEKLKQETPGKFQWLKKYIFFNVEYFTDSADNIKIFVPSEFEDSKPPYFINSPGESVKFFVQEILSDKVKLTIEIEGLFDDISGVKGISIPLEFKDDYFRIGVSSVDKYPCPLLASFLRVCVIEDKNRPGRYVIQKEIDRDIIYSGFYTIQSISVEDYAGNLKTFWSHLENETEDKSGNATVLLPGKMKESTSKKSINFDEEAVSETLEENTELIVSKTQNGNTLLHVVIPDIHHPSLGNISSHLKYVTLYLKGVTTEKKLTFSIHMNRLSRLHSHFNSPEEPGKIILPVVIPKELISEQYEVSDIRFHSQAFSIFTVRFKGAFFFNHVSDQEDRTVPRVRKEDISLKVLKGLNSKGGNTSLLASIPVEGIEPGRDVLYHIKIRTPDGTILSENESGIARWVLKEDENGDQYISVQFDLKPHHLQGEYMLSYVSLMEGYPIRVRGLHVYGNEQETEDRLIERGIKATVHITAPTDVEERILP